MDKPNTKSLPMTQMGTSALDESQLVKDLETRPLKDADFSYNPEWNHAYLELMKYTDNAATSTRASLVVEEFRKQGLSVMNYDLLEEHRWNEDKFRVEVIHVWVRRIPTDLTELVDALRG